MREDMRGFLEDIESEARIDYENGEPSDSTWGLCVLVTSYTDEALQRLDAALSTLTEAVRRFFLRNIDGHFDAYVHEILKRFRLVVVTYEHVLANLSDDRLREEFNTHTRHLHFWPLGEEEDFNCFNKRRPRPGKLVVTRPPAPLARFACCIVLDEAKIIELSKVEFGDALGEGEQRLQDVTVKMIDRSWSYPEWPDDATRYRVDGVDKYNTGVDGCPIRKIVLVCWCMEHCDGIVRMFPIVPIWCK